jgi:hypothetical protein
MKGVPHPLSPEVRLASTRDLVLLVASLLLVILPHAQRAPWWLTLLTLCLYIWRIHYSLNPAPLPSRWLVYGFAVVAMLGVWMEFRTIFGRQPGILLLMLFSGLKVLETRTHRDAAAAAFLGYFLIITNFLYTQSIPTALLMAAALFAITATLISFSAPNRAPRANVRTAMLLLGHAALQRDAGVVFPQMLLTGHALDSGALLLPNRRDVEQHVGHPATLLRLVRLEQHDRRRAQHLLARIVAMRLGDDARVLGKLRRQRVVEIVRIPARMRKDEFRPDRTIEIDEPVERLVGNVQRIVAEIVEPNICNA